MKPFGRKQSSAPGGRAATLAKEEAVDLTVEETGPAPRAGATTRGSSRLPEEVVGRIDDTPLRTALSVLSTIGPPLTIATALMFYFGWARSSAQARAMGVDESLFGFSTQDYVLRSISALYVPLLAMAALALGWLTMHRRVADALSRPAARPSLRTAGRLALALGLSVAIFSVLFAAAYPDRGTLVVPLALAAGTTLAAYGGWLARAAGDSHSSPPAAPPWQGALHKLLVGSVITLALFWELSDYAGVVGRGYAQEIERLVPRLPRATAFSQSPLGIEAPGVREEAIGTGETVSYRTRGLRFLVHSGGRLFLVHDGWTPEGGAVIVLPDNEEVRWQFSR